MRGWYTGKAVTALFGRFQFHARQLTGLAAVLGIIACSDKAIEAQEVARSEYDFFERHVRPILIQRCEKCHAASTSEGSLRLDSRAGLIQGGDRGPGAIVGNPNGSLIMKALSYEDDDLAMPPEGKLSSDEIGYIAEWIASGAPWPTKLEAEAAAPSPMATSELSKPIAEHWAFRAVQPQPLPSVVDSAWPINEIDVFVLGNLEANRIEPSPDADPRTFARRLFLDLTGLPPTYEEVEQFVTELAASPVNEVVDRTVEKLLSRREYGERWGRHWLDVARYADTKGYVDGGQREYAFAYSFRDYVIRAFNEDLPFDQFILDQLSAAELRTATDEQWRLAGMGFLTVGRRFNHNPYDILDDQIDVISRGLQALTVSCARCHDHKYDPIPTADYYSLYGILASSFEPLQPDLPVLGAEPQSPEYRDYAHELRKRMVEYQAEFDKLHRQIESELREFATDYLVYIVKESSRHRGAGQNPLRTELVFLRGPSAYAAGAIRRWRKFIYERDASDPVFGLWHSMDPIEPAEFVEQLEKQLMSGAVHPVIAAAVVAQKPTTMIELAQCYGAVLERVDMQWQQHLHQQSNASGFDDVALESLRSVLYGADSPALLSKSEAVDCYHLDDSTRMRNKAGDIEKLTLEYKQDLPPRAMILRDGDLVAPMVFLRGEHTRLGAKVPRRLPQLFLGEAPREEFIDRSGRVELAQRIASADNPLTARVIVNRVWGWHFGRPLVATPSDFGLRSEPPSHPELLDYLATWFTEHGWSLKQLNRLIVTSRTFRQSSAAVTRQMQTDPENRLLWRFAPRRMELEAIRDSLLQAGGQLEIKSVKGAIGFSPEALGANCRTVYLAIDRQNLSNFARDFDFPTPDMTAPGREHTIVPQQQLFFLNSPLVMEQARIAAKAIAENSLGKRRIITTLFRQILSRDPTEQELVHAEEYCQTLEPQSWERLAHALLQANEFIYIR